MSEDIKKLVNDFLVVTTTPELTMQQQLDRSNNQRDRAIGICDGMMAWETLQDTRNSIKSLSQLKKEINEQS